MTVPSGLRLTLIRGNQHKTGNQKPERECSFGFAVVRDFTYFARKETISSF